MVESDLSKLNLYECALRQSYNIHEHLEPPSHKYIQKQQTIHRQNTNKTQKYAYKNTHPNAQTDI